MYNKTHLLHTKHNSIRNRINSNLNFNFNNNLKLFKFKNKRISQTNTDRKRAKTALIRNIINNNIINNNNKYWTQRDPKLSSVKRTRYSFVRLRNRKQNSIKTETNVKTFANLLRKSNYFNKRLIRNGHHIKNRTKYYANNNYNYNNCNNYLNSNRSKSFANNPINGSKEKTLKAKVVIIGGIAYRVTRNTMTKKLSPKEVSKPKPNYSSNASSVSLESKERLNIHNNNKTINNLKTDNNSVNNNTINSNNSKESQKSKILIVRGIKYEMDANGKTLRQVADNGQTVSPTDRRLSRLDIGGLTYRCSKPGLFISTNAERVRQLRNRAIKSSINRILLAKCMPKKHCIFFCRFGRCLKGTECPYIHDKDKIAVCSRFIRGTCKATDCPFSHDVAPEKMPVCSFFLQGRCSSDSCPYRHVKVNSDAQICKDFLCGYCPKGIQCKSAHIFVCIDFNRNGKCSKGDSCPLPHNRIGTKVRKKRKISKNCLTLKSAKTFAQILDIDTNSQSQPLPSYIPLSNDNNIKSDNNETINVDKTDTNSSDLPAVKRKDKVKYFWTESDDESSHCFSETDDYEENACRPTIRIIPRFLFD